MTKTSQRLVEASVVLLLVVLLAAMLLPSLSSSRQMAGASDARGEALLNMSLADTSSIVGGSSIRPTARNFEQEDTEMPSALPRQIARSARMTVRVDDVGAFIAAGTALAEQRGGYVLEASHNPGHDRRDVGSLKLSVPADTFSSLLDGLRGLAGELEDEQLSAEDVTDAVVDLDARLTNLRTAEERLREILGDIKSQDGSASEVIEVFRELTDLRGQIERIEASRRNLRQRVHNSTVTLRVNGREAPRAAIEEPEMGPAQAWAYAVSTLKSTLRWLLNGVIFVGVAVLPVVAVIVIPVAAVGWLWGRSRKHGKA